MELGQNTITELTKKIDTRFLQDILLAFNELLKNKTVTTLGYFKMKSTWFNNNIKINELPIYLG